MITPFSYLSKARTENPKTTKLTVKFNIMLRYGLYFINALIANHISA
jgi:hypothetical protein